MEEKNKLFDKKTIITIMISAIISITLTLGIIGYITSDVSLDDFSVGQFNLDTDKETYTYSEETSYTFEGSAKITCSEKKHDYLVLIEVTNSTDNSMDYNYIVVHNGEGEITTYDYEFSKEEPKKPNYSFKIIGYKSFENN